MLSFTKDKSLCTGCAACMSACPVSCITMINDAEGFKYPISSDKCIECGLCQRICPIENEPSHTEIIQPIAFACASKDAKVWRRSASGGAFIEICRVYGDDKTIIVGAAWDGLDVKHICIEGIENIAPLCKSKYVASDTSNVLRPIKTHLAEGRKVIFCGTPCQVAGLKAYLGKEYENLLTIDLICHGVGSPAVFKEAVKATGAQLSIEIKEYQFRAKRKVYETDHLQLVRENKNKAIYLTQDQYIQLFLSQLCLRPSCGHNCQFRNMMRQGDITLADFKGMRTIFPDLAGSKRNYSTVVANTSKGNSVVELLRDTTDLRSITIEDVIKFNPLFAKQTWSSNDRDEFFSDFVNSPQSAILKWTKPANLYHPTFVRRIANIAPEWLVGFIYRMVKR